MRFEVGNRVRRTSGWHGDAKVGSVGTVIEVSSGLSIRVLVDGSEDMNPSWRHNPKMWELIGLDGPEQTEGWRAYVSREKQHQQQEVLSN